MTPLSYFDCDNKIKMMYAKPYYRWTCRWVFDFIDNIDYSIGNQIHLADEFVQHTI